MILRYQISLAQISFDVSNPKEITDPVRKKPVQKSEKNQKSNPNVRTIKILFLKNRYEN